MAAELEMPEKAASFPPRSRRPKQKKRKNPSKGSNTGAKRKKPSEKLKRLYRKRAREYDSDNEDEDEDEDEEETRVDHEYEEEEEAEEINQEVEKEEIFKGDIDDFKGDIDDDDDNNEDDDDSEEDEDDEEEGEDGEARHATVTKLLEGSRAFRLAFTKIVKIKLPDDPLGPILSAHKKLIAEKLAEEDDEHKVKKTKRKEKKLAAEKGHVKPTPNFLDSKEKYLISVATKGVVKLFNAVRKAQNPQRGTALSKSKDAKELSRRRKKTFLSELRKPTKQVAGSASKENNEHGWAPLRDSFMVSNSRLKDWDKMPDPAEGVGQETVSMMNSSDDD